MRKSIWCCLVWCGLMFVGSSAGAVQPEPGILGDAAAEAWATRAQGFDGEWATADPVGRAVAGFEEHLAIEPENLIIHVELMRALFFQASFTQLEDDAKGDVFVRGVAVSDSAIRLLHGAEPILDREPADLIEEMKDTPEAGAIHFWSAVHWGSWGDTQGVMAALREGVAKRLRLHSLVGIELDPTYDNAGPYRFFGRMHALAPKVPMFTGWINRDTAVELLEKAYELVPEDPQNRHFLAEAWLAHRKARRADAIAMLRDLGEAEPRPHYVVEDSFALKAAKAALEEIQEP